MSRPAVLPMESYRLAGYATQVPCYICSGFNTFDSELCRHCQAPMALAHQAAQKMQPRMVAILGPAAAGKTVYLGMLVDMLSRHSNDLQVMARGAFSISLQQATTASLTRCLFPEKTPNEPDRWNWIHCQILAEQRKQSIELIMPDLAGESLAEEIDHPNSFPVIRAFLTKCDGVILLLDVQRLMDGDENQDYVAMKILSYLCELVSDPKKGWPGRPVALMFTKADQCDECFLDPTEFAQKHTPGLWNHVQKRLSQHQFFASSVAGACAYGVTKQYRFQVPLRVEPRGIVEPFVWLVDHLVK